MQRKQNTHHSRFVIDSSRGRQFVKAAAEGMEVDIVEAGGRGW